MTDQTPEQTTPVLPPTPEPPAPETPKPTPPKTVRYAAYDKTFLRFVGGTHLTAKAARDAAKERGAKAVEIREV